MFQSSFLAIGMVVRCLVLWSIILGTTTTTMRTTTAATVTEDLSQFLYLKEDPHSVYPIRDYKPTKDDPKALKPDFLYGTNYPHPRIVEFYAHWCPHCQHFKPEYIKFARAMDQVVEEINLHPSSSLSSSPLIIEYHAISCVPNQKLCSSQNIKGYPHIAYYPAGNNTGTKLKFVDIHPMAILRLNGIDVAGGSGGAIGNNQEDVQQQRRQQQQSPNQILPYFRDRTKVELYHDAHLSFDFAMRTAIYTSEGPLAKRPTAALKDFLQLLQQTLPPLASLQPVLKELLDTFGTAVIKGDSQLTDIMNRHPVPTITTNSPQNRNQQQQQWSPACTQHGTGYTCGLWILFHIMSIGSVEWNEMVTTPEWSGLKPTHTADTLRGFVEHFFQCEECRANFLHEYDACSYDRCNRLIDVMKGGTMKNWIQLPLWLYETHNAVNTRLRKERIDIRKQQQREGGGDNLPDEIDYDSTSTEQDVLWPPKDKCPACWLSEGRWDEDNVYRYLRLEYWPDDYKSAQIRHLLFNETPPLSSSQTSALLKQRREMALDKLIKDTEFASAQQFRLILMVVFGLLAAFAITNWYGKKQQFVQKGFHKKHESFFRQKV